MWNLLFDFHGWQVYGVCCDKSSERSIGFGLSSINRERIVQGINAVHGEWPFMVISIPAGFFWIKTWTNNGWNVSDNYCRLEFSAEGVCIVEDRWSMTFTCWLPLIVFLSK
jgi:hypothetical protein